MMYYVYKWCLFGMKQVQTKYSTNDFPNIQSFSTEGVDGGYQKPGGLAMLKAATSSSGIIYHAAKDQFSASIYAISASLHEYKTGWLAVSAYFIVVQASASWQKKKTMWISASMGSSPT